MTTEPMAELVHPVPELQMDSQPVEIDTLDESSLLEKQQVDYMVVVPTDEMCQGVDALDSTEVTSDDTIPTTIVATATATATPTVPDMKTPQKQSLRRSFTTEFKLECVEHAERTKNKTETARLFNVNRRRVQEWCLQKEKLMAVPKQQKRLSGGGRRQVCVDQLQLRPDKPSPLVLDDAVAKDYCITTPVSGTPPESEMTIEHAASSGDSQVPPVQGIESISPEAIMDNIVRGLTTSDPSNLPSNMLKVIHDLSSEIMSQDTKAAMESMIRDASIDLLLQKDEDVSSSPIPMPVDVVSTNASHPDKSLSSGMSTATDQGLMSRGHGVCDGNVERDEHADVHGEAAGGNMLHTPGSSMTPGSSVGQSVVDTVQVAILEAFMQVLSSMQGSSTDLLQSPSTKAASSNSGDQEPSISNTPQPPTTDDVMTEEVPVAMEVNSDAMKENVVLPEAPSIANDSEQTLSAESPKDQDTVSGDTKPSSTKSGVRKGKKCYTVDFKLECVAYAEANSKCAAARKFSVDRRRVQDWCSQKEKLQQLKWPSLGKKNMDIDIERQLASWVREQQEAGKALSRRMVGEQAVKLYGENGNSTFSASIGWVAKFMIRNEISLVSTGRSHHQRPHPQLKQEQGQTELAQPHPEPELVQPHLQLQPELIQPHPPLEPEQQEIDEQASILERDTTVSVAL